MCKKKVASLLIILVFSLSFAQCERKDIYNTSGSKPFSILTFDISSWLAYPNGINVQVGTVKYTPASTYNFGTVTVGSASPAVVFTILNTGTEDITLSGPPIVAVSGVDSGDFSATDPSLSILTPGSSTFFAVNFTPGAVGPRNGVITIQSNDANRPIYSIMLTGIGAAPQPDINVHVFGTGVPSGTSYYLGERLINEPASSVTFIIENTGTAALHLNAPYISLGGTDAGDVTFTLPAIYTIGPGGSTTFSVWFTPSAEGDRFATIQIPNDDPDSFEQPYIINLRATGVMPVMVIHGNNSSYTSVYDPTQNKFNPGNALSGPVTFSGHSFPAEYLGTKYRILLHGGGSISTSRYDPTSQTFTSGPTTITGINLGTHSVMVTGGSNAGNTMVICGSTSPSVIMYYNPGLSGSDSFTDSGLSFNTIASDRSFSLPNAAGNTLIVLANNGPYYQLFDQTDNTLGSTMMIDSNAYVMNGAHAFEIPSGNVNAGLWLVIQGPGTSGGDLTWLYDPSGPSFTAGPTLTAYAADGAFSIPITSGTRAGMALIVHGNGLYSTSLYNTNGSITTGPTFSAGIGSIYAGAFAFNITGGAHKGRYMIIHGNFQRYTTIFNPETLLFEADDTSDDLPLTGVPAAWGAHAFPAR
jgi:hypothetical protein